MVASTDRFFVFNKINLSPNFFNKGVKNSRTQEFRYLGMKRNILRPLNGSPGQAVG